MDSASIVANVMECYHALGACTRCTSRWTGASGFHRDSEGERLSVAAHRAVRPVRRADRNPDSHRRHGQRSPNAALPRTGSTRPTRRLPTARRTARANGCRVWSIEQTRSASSLEFIENVKVDLFPDEVYLFTPKGSILALPRNATALDFAYAVHTNVGNHAVAARVDKQLVPLRTRLISGQTVEIITAPSAAPSPQWLEWVVSGKARTAIRHHLKRLQQEDAIDFGHRMLDRALDALGGSLDVDSLARCLNDTSTDTRSSASRNCSPISRWATACPMRWRVRCCRRRAIRRLAAGAQRREDPDHRRRTRRAQFRQLLPSGSGRRDHGISFRRQGRRRASHRMPERAGVPQVARTLHRDRLGPRMSSATTRSS